MQDLFESPLGIALPDCSIERGFRAVQTREPSNDASNDNRPLFICLPPASNQTSLFQDAIQFPEPIASFSQEPPCPIDALADYLRMFTPHWPGPEQLPPKSLPSSAERSARANATTNGFFPSTASLASSCRNWVEDEVKERLKTNALQGTQWGAMSTNWSIDHGNFFRWLYPNSKCIVILDGPEAALARWREQSCGGDSTESCTRAFLSSWTAWVIDTWKRAKPIDALVLVWSELSHPKSKERLQRLTPSEFRRELIEESIAGAIRESFSHLVPKDLELIAQAFQKLTGPLRSELFPTSTTPSPRVAYRYSLGVGAKASLKPESISSPISTRDRRGKCAILVPHLHSIEPECEQSLRQLEERGYVVRRLGGIPAVDLARNILATQALRDGFEELLWIDDDMSFHPDAVDQIRSWGLPLVGGIVAKKGQRSFATIFHRRTKRIHLGVDGGLLDVDKTGTGFLLTHRDVYDAIARHYELTECRTMGGENVIPFFLPEIVPTEDGNWYMAEDYAFVERAKNCGFATLVDTSIRLGHIGKYSFTWEDVGMDRKQFSSFSLDL